MDLPESVSAVAAALADGGTPAPSPALFEDREVFAAEFAHIFLRPWLAADHVSRLPEDGRWFLAQAGARSLLITRENAQSFHALRNTCIHAGYPVCEDEEGEAELLCPYHGWQYAIDGRLVEPRLSTEQASSARYRLPSYPLHVAGGLFFVDPSGAGEAPPPVAALPAWLAAAMVCERARFEAKCNWKPLRNWLWAAPELFCDHPVERIVDIGPLCRLIAADGEEAVLLTLVPRSAERSEFRLVRMAPEARKPDGAAAERIAAGLEAALRRMTAAPLGSLDRDFFLWYAGLMG